MKEYFGGPHYVKDNAKAAFWDSDGRKRILGSTVWFVLILSNNYHLRNRQKWNNIITVLQHEVHDFVLVLFSFIHTLHSV